MPSDEEEDLTVYAVVVNPDAQYSIWPADREPPAGWTRVDCTGPKPHCLEWIRTHWTDMRPLSVRTL